MSTITIRARRGRLDEARERLAEELQRLEKRDRQALRARAFFQAMINDHGRVALQAVLSDLGYRPGAGRSEAVLPPAQLLPSDLDLLRVDLARVLHALEPDCSLCPDEIIDCVLCGEEGCC